MVISRWLISLLFLIFLVQISKSQNANLDLLKVNEDSLSVLMKIIYSDRSLEERENACSTFLSTLKRTLKIQGAFDYSFDSLKHLGKITSDDHKLRVFTWNLPQSEGFQKYFGFILLKEKRNVRLIELIDSRQLISDPIKEILSADKWMGALYYSIIEKKINGKTNYILLGLDFNNLFSSKKIIEVLTFSKDSKPIFGAQIFKVGNSAMNRVVFEYSARAAMTLRYIPDLNTIAFDHLSPSKTEYANNFQFYGPDFTYDGFQFNKGSWVYVRNIDLRNTKRGVIKPKESPEKIQEPGFVYKSKGGLPQEIKKK